MPPRGPLPGLCPDWVLVVAPCNVHVARDRGWFSTYTPFPTTVDDPILGVRHALGVGDVHIPVKLFPKRHGTSAHGTLHLRDVLHIPTAICNYVCNQSTRDFCAPDNHRVFQRGVDGMDVQITGKGGRRVGYFENMGGPQSFFLKLSGPPTGPVVGPSAFTEEVCVPIVTWRDSERQRWKNKQIWTTPQAVRLGKDDTAAEVSYTDEEKARMELEWEMEFYLCDAGAEFVHLTANMTAEDRDEFRTSVDLRRLARVLADRGADTNM